MIEFEQLRIIPYEKRTSCMVCGAIANPPILEYPNLPLTGLYTREKPKEKLGFLDLGFQLCQNCGHGQLSNIVRPEVLYGETYGFRTSQSATAIKAADLFLSFIIQSTGKKFFKTVLDIGCSDLVLLNSLRANAEHLVGVDPVLKGRESELADEKLEVLGDFFEHVDLSSRRFELVVSSHTLEHVRDPKAFIASMLKNATEGTTIALQFPILDILLKDLRFDQIFHQHLNYFSFASIFRMLDDLGAAVIDYKVNYQHWGTVMVLIKKGRGPGQRTENHTTWIADDVLAAYSKFRDMMKLAKSQLDLPKGTLIYGYGAALMLPVLSYHLNNDLSCLKAVLDDDESKDGLSYINLPVTIRSAKIAKDIRESVVLVTSVDNSRKILEKLIPMAPKRIILPLGVI